MKYVSLATLFSVVTSFLPSAAVFAQTTPTAMANSTNTPFVYFKDFDVVALDFTVNSFTGDWLSALTVAKSGSAREGIEYSNVTLWADRGTTGFQGWGYDAELGEGRLENGLWVFSPVSAFLFPSTSQRFFVTIETGDSPADKNLQLSILQGGDDGDHMYEVGEQGIFLSNSVVMMAPEPAYSQVITIKSNKLDQAAPKAYVSAISIDAMNPTVLHGAQTPNAVISFYGEARDRNGSNIAYVKLMVNGLPYDAQGAGVGFANWAVNYTPTMPYEELVLRVVASDGSREFTSEPYYVVIDNRLASPTKSTITAMPDIITVDEVSTLKVVLRAEDNSVISGRDVTFSTLRGSDALSQVLVKSDSSGMAQVQLNPELVGFAQVDILVDGSVLGSAGVTVVEPDGPVVVPVDPFATGSLVKGSQDAVYYIGSDGKRHVFVDFRVYQSWYGNSFASVRTVSDHDLAGIALGSPVPYRPGTLIKVPSLPAVYVVDVGQTLRHVSSETLAKELFGTTWNQQVKDLSEALLFTYDFGSPIEQASDLNMARIEDPLLTIDAEL